MAFHLERRLNGALHRSGTHATYDGALSLASRETDRPVLIVFDPNDAVSAGSGDVEAAILDDGLVIRRPEQPAWWAALSAAASASLLAGDVTAEVATSITSAGGTVVATQWDGLPMSGWTLLDADGDWVRFESPRRQVRGS